MQVYSFNLRAVCPLGAPHLHAQAKTLGFTEKATVDSKPVIVAACFGRQRSDLTTGLREHYEPSGCRSYAVLTDSGQNVLSHLREPPRCPRRACHVRSTGTP